MRTRSRAATPSVECMGEYPSSLAPFRNLTRGRTSSKYKGTPEQSQDEVVNTPAPASKADTPAPFQGVSQQEVTKRHCVAMTPIAENNGASGSDIR